MTVRAPTTILCCLLIAMSLGGCGGASTAGGSTPNANGDSGAELVVADATSPDEPLPAALPYGVRWSDVATVTSTCFFFSGPGELGRDTSLGDQATFAIGDRRARLDFGADVAFDGPRAGDRITLSRISTHDYDGGKWTVRETITLDVAPAGGWTGHYHYDEYEPGAATPGTCHIDASVLVGM